MMPRTKGGPTIRRNSPKQQDGDSLVERQMEHDNNETIGILAQNISSIKQLSKNIGSTLKEDETMLDDLENGFGKSETLMNNTMGKLNKLMNSSGGNVL